MLMRTGPGAIRGGWRVLACLLALGALIALNGCGTAPDKGTLPASKATPPPARSEGEVLARNERLLVYESARGDTLAGIAKRFLGSAELGWVVGDFNRLAPNQDLPDTLIVPLAQRNPWGIYGDRYQTVPILCYHRFAKASNGKMTVAASAFAAQLDWLVRNQYHVLRLAELREWMAGKKALPLRSVVITVDDGYASFYRLAYPALKQHGLPATLFVYTDFIGAADAVNWSELQEMTRSGLVDVQAHSRTHRNLIERALMDTDAQYQQTLQGEVRVPRELLAQKLGNEQVHFAYPYGDANESVLDVLSRHHYELGVSTTPGGNAFFAQPLMLRRTMIFGDMSLEAFKAQLQVSRAITPP